MQYLVTYQTIEQGKNGNTQAVAVVLAASYWISTNRNGGNAKKCEYVEKVQIVGHKDEVWEVVDRLLGSERIGLVELPQRKSVNKTNLPTIHPENLDRWIHQSVLQPHVAIAAAQNRQDDQNKETA